MHKILYLDTNIFLHYQPFTQINWLEIVEAEFVTIVIPPITIRELTKHKDSHPRPQIKKRAGETIKRLSGILDLGATPKLTEAISVYFEDRDSIIDFTAYQLNFNIQDDQLIASILMRRQEAPDEYIVLVTSDLGLALVAKAGRQGINTHKMPENLRISDEPDPNEKKVKQLEQQIRELNSRTPNLALVYEDGKQHSTIKLPYPISRKETEIDAKIVEIKNKFPIRRKEDSSKEADIPKNALEKASILTSMSAMNVIPEEEFGRYNSEVEKYIPAYTNFLVSKINYINLNSRTVRLDIALTNNGTTPAEDIDIYLHFPDGFQLIEEDELPKPPKPPTPPVEPMTEMHRLTKSIDDLSQMLPTSMYYNPSDPLPTLPQNVSSPNIKRVTSYEVHVHVQKIKHNLQVFLDPLYVIFDDFESANSFTIDYRILAANIPYEIIGTLHLVVQKDSSNLQK